MVIDSSSSKRLVDLLKQRFPFLLVERVIACEPGREIRGKKIFSTGDLWSGFPVPQKVPLFLLIEMLGQLSEILIRVSYKEEQQKTSMLVMVNGVEINGSVDCGDTVEINSVLVNKFKDLYLTRATAFTPEGATIRAILVHTFR